MLLQALWLKCLICIQYIYQLYSNAINRFMQFLSLLSLLNKAQLQAALSERDAWQQKAAKFEDTCETLRIVSR